MKKNYDVGEVRTRALKRGSELKSDALDRSATTSRNRCIRNSQKTYKSIKKYIFIFFTYFRLANQLFRTQLTFYVTLCKTTHSEIFFEENYHKYCGKFECLWSLKVFPSYCETSVKYIIHNSQLQLKIRFEEINLCDKNS